MRAMESGTGECALALFISLEMKYNVKSVLCCLKIPKERNFQI